MLQVQKEAPEFTGGLEAKRLESWHAEALRVLRPKQMFFAYDTEDDYEPLVQAGKLLRDVGFVSKSKRTGRPHAALRCYVLCGWPKDTMEAAEARMKKTLSAGFVPMAMLYRDTCGKKPAGWSAFARRWIRVACMFPKAIVS
jgi:hypothetical protein